MPHKSSIIRKIISPFYGSFWVATGGILGTLSRYGMDTLFPIPHISHPSFPWTTFWINISGAALLGFLIAWTEETHNHPKWLRPFGAIGFCGAYTTLSTANVEFIILCRADLAGTALTYIAASIFCGLIAVTLTTAIAVAVFTKGTRTQKASHP